MDRIVAAATILTAIVWLTACGDDSPQRTVSAPVVKAVETQVAAPVSTATPVLTQTAVPMPTAPPTPQEGARSRTGPTSIPAPSIAAAAVPTSATVPPPTVPTTPIAIPSSAAPPQSAAIPSPTARPTPTAIPSPTVPPTPTAIPSPTVPPTPTPVPITEINFAGIVTTTNVPSQVQVVFSLRDQEGHAIVRPAREIEQSVSVFEKGPGTDGSWEEIDYTETSFFVHTAENIDLEVVFVLDLTNSMSEAHLSDGRSGIEAMLDAFEASLAVLPSAHRVGVVEFHDRNARPSVLSPLTTDRRAILSSVGDFMTSGFDPGSSRVWDTVVTGSDLFSSRGQNPRAVRALIFLSDGRDTSSDNTREQAVQYASERGVQLYAIGVGDVFQEPELHSAALSTDGSYYSARDLNLIQEQIQLLVNDLRGQYQLTYITLRRTGEYGMGIAVDLAGVSGWTAVSEFDVAGFFGADNHGVVGFDPPSLDRANQRATVFMRALHVPRNIDRIRFRVQTTKPLQVELVPSNDGGLLEGWTLSGPDEGWYEARSATPLEFGNLGLLAKLTLSDITEEGLSIPVWFDNSIYTGGKSVARVSYMEIGDFYPTGRIAFVTERDEDVRLIYLMNADGSNVSRLFWSDRAISDPVWSPDGEQLAYHRDGAGIELYSMSRSFGPNLTRSLDLDTVIDPEWSPDGSRIVFAASQESSDSLDIYVMSADGSNVIKLTDSDARNRVPDWSPDGRRILFTSADAGDLSTADIYVMNADGSGDVRLTSNGHLDFDPVWSPDGQRIAFYSDREDGDSEIYVMDADGTNVTRITNFLGHGSCDPDWSPDGHWVVFSSRQVESGGGYDIYIVRLDGSSLTRLTDDGANNLDPSWTIP